MDDQHQCAELAEASELLNMLDHLVKGLAQASSNGRQLPWTGISLVIDRCRYLLQQVQEQYFEAEDTEPAACADILKRKVT